MKDVGFGLEHFYQFQRLLLLTNVSSVNCSSVLYKIGLLLLTPSPLVSSGSELLALITKMDFVACYSC